MEWERYWNSRAATGDQLAQVGRINAGAELAVTQAVERIHALLQLDTTDKVLDVCCGNGLLTGLLSKSGLDITGIDIAPKLIEQAQTKYDNINFYVQDALILSINEKFNKVFIAFSFQYFDTYDKGKKVLEKLLEHTTPKATILLTDIPDKDRWGSYYNTLLKKLFYFKQQLTGTQSMGKFWKKKELDEICASLGVHGAFIKQPEALPYSYYRFDYLISKNKQS